VIWVVRDIRGYRRRHHSIEFVRLPIHLSRKFCLSCTVFEI